MDKKLVKNVGFWFLLSIFVYVVLYLITDSNTEIDFSFITKNIFNIFIAVLIISFSYFIKFYRWISILQENKINTKTYPQKKIFINSLLFSFTPGKVGEFIKAVYLENYFNIKKRKGIYYIIVEKIFEYLALLILFIFFLGNFYLIVFLIVFLVSVLIIILRVSYSVNKYLSFFKRFRNYFLLIKRTKKQFIIKLITISILIWLLECLAFIMIAQNYYFLDIIRGYIISMFAGSVSFLPAGIGVTDFSLSYFLKSTEELLNIIFIIRFLTIWAPVLFSCMFIVYMKIFTEISKRPV